VIKPSQSKSRGVIFLCLSAECAGVCLALGQEKLWGWWANFKVETSITAKRTPAQIARDQQFRAMLDAAGAHYEFEPPEECDRQIEPRVTNLGADF